MKPFVKFCGFFREKDILKVRTLPVSYIGFISVPSSKRYVTDYVAKRCISLLGKHQSAVLVVQNETVQTILQKVRDIPFSVIQLHGEETVEDCKQLKKRCKAKIWKALPYTKVNQCNEYAKVVDTILLDHIKAGSGQTFDWSMIKDVYENVSSLGCQLIIAGGIHSGNIRTLLQYPCDGIDLASGIETNGRKDRKKMKTILEVIADE
ncbi:MAG TPA: phosphoribosylanthranilate isomerase [Massilibacterium sp.]|nr:phosphoribosylanthranilate isomerase [Massilibacterium sp.]